MQSSQRSIPKFTSFRSKPAPEKPKPRPNSPDDLSISDGRDSDNIAFSHRVAKDGYKRRRKEDGGHRHGQGHDRHLLSHRSIHRQRSRSGNTRCLENNRSATVEIVKWDDCSNTFEYDTKGDPDNLTYGTIHRYIIPSFNRSGAGSILGLSGNSKIDRESSNERIIRLTNGRYDGPKKRNKTILPVSDGSGLRKLLVQKNQPISDISVDFIPLDSRTGRRRRAANASPHRSGDSESSGEESPHYKSIEGKSKDSHRASGQHLEFASYNSDSNSEDGRTVALDESIRQRSITLSRRVRDEHTSADAWLDLIDHQEALIGIRKMNDKESKATPAEHLSTAEVKLSMYEQAAKQVIEGRERILLGMMEEGAKIWELKKQSHRWKVLLRENPFYIGLWRKYINFRQTESMTFRLEEVKTVYIECLEILKQAESERCTLTVSPIFELQLYVLLRMTLFWQEAGFTELAVAIWQAILEYRFFNPSQLSQHTSTIDPSLNISFLAAFEKFWDSEVLRIGERGASGWLNYAANGGSIPQSKEDHCRNVVNETHIFGTWVACEKERSTESSMPARVIDDVHEDDPYRVVLFSDMKEIISHIEEPCMNFKEDHVVLAAFLCFHHLPPILSHLPTPQEWLEDSFIRNDDLQSSAEDSLLWDIAGFVATEEAPFKYAQPFFRSSTDTLFGSPQRWISTFATWGKQYNVERDCRILESIRSVLLMLMNKDICGDDLAEYYMAFELHYSPETVKKTAKSILKKRPSNLRLYNAYALVEYRLGNVEAAQKVIATALNMSKQLDLPAQQNSILLWRTWVWELLSLGKISLALDRLLALLDETINVEEPDEEGILIKAPRSTKSTAMLRVQRALIHGRDQLLSPLHTIAHTECLVLLSYLSENLSINAALSAIDSNLHILSNEKHVSSANLELLHQFRARLLYEHTLHTRSYKPAILRDTLAESIRMFPGNTIFLSLYAWNESRFRVDDRLRSIISDIVFSHERRRQESIISWFFTLWTEMRRGVVMGSNIHAIRGTFERAVASESGKNSAALWKLYFKWEKGIGERGRAKAVFWRAIRACPWAKELYMLAFVHLRESMLFDELRGVYELLGQKGVRVHVALDDAFEKIDARHV